MSTGSIIIKGGNQEAINQKLWCTGWTMKGDNVLGENLEKPGRS